MPLSSIKGTGPDGRIVKADIEDYLGNVPSVPIFPGTYVSISIQPYVIV